MITKNEVKYIQSLAHQKNRNEAGVFLAEGVRLVEDLLKCIPDKFEVIYAVESCASQWSERAIAIPVKVISAEELARISQMQSPNQVLAVIRQFDFSLPKKDSSEWMLALDGIQDPGNMGTIIRLADWFGIKHVLCSKDCVDLYNPKVVQATMGSISRVSVHYVELKDVILSYKLPLIGAMMTGESLQSFQFPNAGIIVIGNEGRGIRHELANILTRSVTIPSFGGAESLNAGMATGIILWELKSK